MTAQEKALAAKLSVIQSIPKEKVRYPDMPMDTYLQEAEYLYKWCLPDKPVLIKAGLDWFLVTDMPVRIDAAREAQSVWHNVRFGREEAQKLWVAKSPAGYAMRSDIIHEMRWGYRRLPELLVRVDAVADGTGDADMIQDLNDLSVIGRENPKPLTKVGFDVALLDEAARQSKALGALRADASVDKEADRKKKKLRDRAYSHLGESVNEIRECGQHVFWRDEERAKGYASEYKRRARKSAASPPIPAPADPESDTTS